MSNAPAWIVFQPLIVGLGAVVIATIGNTLLEWYRQNLAHRREARVVRHAFIAELRTLREMYSGAMDSEQRNDEEADFMVPLDRYMPVHDTLLARIGLLDPDEVCSILNSYSKINLSPKSLGILGQIRADEFSKWIEVPSRYRDVLINLHDSIVEAIDDTLRILTKNARLPPTQRDDAKLTSTSA